WLPNFLLQKNGFIMCQEDNFYGSLRFKKHIGCSEKFKKSSDLDRTLKLFPLLATAWGSDEDTRRSCQSKGKTEQMKQDIV
ncbi:hypothetical protein EK904_007365, partial [Melospiza melodia maxima]